MSLPDILPTGAMASGDYVDYMIGYCNLACDSLTEQLKSYWGDSTIVGWNSQWSRITADMNTDLNSIQSEITKLNAQIRMADDAIGKL